MNLIIELQRSFASFLKQTFTIDDTLAKLGNFTLNTDASRQKFGDLSSNIALLISKKLGKNPRQISQEIMQQFSHPAIEKMELAGPGFINAYLTQNALVEIAQQLYIQREEFFKLPIHPKKYNIEFVSANPTGPLHFGHGRGGIIGDVLGNILRFLGNKVAKEFYINDAGTQIQKLGNSFKIRCLQALGQDIQLPEDGYQGHYLIELAQRCVDEYGEKLRNKDDYFFADYAKKHLLESIQKTLTEYGIHFDTWFSEKTLHDKKLIDQTVTTLEQQEYIFTKDDALWFLSTKFGDDKDRVIRKKDGNWTYIAADIAYLINKVTRDFDTIIMILGHDHHSYAVRLQNIRKALQLKPPLDIILYQLVNIKQSGKLVQMSKRAGRMTTLSDVIQTVGKDVARFFYLQRKADAPLDFDLELALKKTDENPVYYIQYAYVRTKSIFEKAAENKLLQDLSVQDLDNIGPEESLLIKKVASLQTLLANISANNQVHLLSYYIIELADLFHKYYSHHRVINLEDIPKSRARLVLIQLLRNTFYIVLQLMGISTPERM